MQTASYIYIYIYIFVIEYTPDMRAYVLAAVALLGNTFSRSVLQKRVFIHIVMCFG